MSWLWNSPTVHKLMAPIEEHKSLHWPGVLPLTAGNENWKSLVSCALECANHHRQGTNSSGSDPGVPRAVGSCRFCTPKCFLLLDQWNGGGVSYVLTDCKTRRAVCINGRSRHSCARAESGVGALWRTASRPPVGAVSRPTCRARSCDASSAARRRHVRAPRPGSAGSGRPGSRSRAAGARGGGAMAGGPQENTLLHLFAGGWVWRAAPEASSAAVRTPGALWGRGAAAVGCF